MKLFVGTYGDYKGVSPAPGGTPPPAGGYGRKYLLSLKVLKQEISTDLVGILIGTYGDYKDAAPAPGGTPPPAGGYGTRDLLPEISND